MIYTDLWPLIQQDLLNTLAADDFLGTRKFVAVEPGDVESALDTKVLTVTGIGSDSKIGVGGLILPIEEASDDNANLPGGPLKLSIRIQWVENVVLNRSARGTNLPCRCWVAATEKLLKLYTPVGLTQCLVPASSVISEFTPDRDNNLRVGQLSFFAMEADFTPFNRVSRPQITVAGGGYPYAVTVTPAAIAANTYYTTDGSHPWSGNAQAQLYTAPVNIPAACLFRCRSFPGPGQNTVASDTNAWNFP